MVPQLVVHTVVSQFFEENAYIVHREGETDCVVVDPGFDVEEIQHVLTSRSLQLTAILNTHGHADHIAGNAGLCQLWPGCSVVIGRLDAPKLRDAVGNLSAQFGGSVLSPQAEVLVSEGDTVRFAGLDLAVLETPGHSCGHVVYLWKASSPWVAFVGDVLFQGSIGRSDFADGDLTTLLASIRDQLYTLPDDTIILAGHGPATTVGVERRTNPFVTG